jgi:hypothetical protein
LEQADCDGRPHVAARSHVELIAFDAVKNAVPCGGGASAGRAPSDFAMLP